MTSSVLSFEVNVIGKDKTKGRSSGIPTKLSEDGRIVCAMFYGSSFYRVEDRIATYRIDTEERVRRDECKVECVTMNRKGTSECPTRQREEKNKKDRAWSKKTQERLCIGILSCRQQLVCL